MPTRKIVRHDPTTATGPRLSVAGSLALHAAIIAATLLTWHHSLDMPSDQTPSIPVDLITIAQKTNIAPARIPTPPKEEIVPPQPNLVAAPTPPAIQPPKFEVAPDTKPVKPKPPTKKELQQDLSDLLDNLTKPQSKKGKAAARNIEGAGAQDAMTADLSDALRGQIYRCWNPPTGVPHADQLIVSFQLSLARDGSVAQPPQLSGTSDNGNPYMQAAIEAARRAIYTCAPYKLPVNRYSDWGQSTVVFNPRNLAD
jgi:hypothetical protein